MLTKNYQQFLDGGRCGSNTILNINGKSMSNISTENALHFLAAVGRHLGSIKIWRRCNARTLSKDNQLFKNLWLQLFTSLSQHERQLNCSRLISTCTIIPQIVYNWIEMNQSHSTEKYTRKITTSGNSAPFGRFRMHNSTLVNLNACLIWRHFQNIAYWHHADLPRSWATSFLKWRLH